MAHVNYPTDFLSQTILLDNIIEQVGKDGSSGPLVAMLDSKGIDLTEDKADSIDAVYNNTLFLVAAKTSKKLRQQRDSLMKPIMKHLKGAFQYLKKLYNPNFKLLSDWGGTISNSGKITYPPDTKTKVDLLMTMKEKNDSYITTPSPLQPYLTQNKISLGTDAMNGSTANTYHIDFTEAKKESEKYRQDRDNDFAKPLAHIHEIGSFLMKVFINNPQTLGDYGFDIVEEVEPDKARIINMDLGEAKTHQEVKLGSSIINSGAGSLFIYKGKKIAGDSLELKAGETFIITKGYSIFSVKNPSSTQKGQLTLIPK